MLKRLIVLIATAFFAQAALADKPPVYSDRNGAIRGYDPVAYFDRKGPVRGSKQFTHQWNGATWHFANAENRDKFAGAPQKYAPQYGGYCAYGVAQGYTPEIDPNAWSVVDGKLYLNLNRDIQARWNKDIPGYIKKADANWPRVLKD
ncbi:MAG: YHS domain protein [Betaproteobacteria bacterium]|jgi:YHS domain-containing protein|nr:YHS domain protein [Betaproteobacteria bacterium]